MSRTLSTDSVAARQRTAFWTDLVCDTYVQLQCDPHAGRDAIDGEIVADELATLQLSRVTATAQLVRRTPALIAFRRVGTRFSYEPLAAEVEPRAVAIGHELDRARLAACFASAVVPFVKPGA